MQDRWREACRKAKGTQVRVGSIKNYTFAGLMIAYTMDPREEEEKKKAAANLMLREMGNEAGQLDMDKAHKLDQVVGQAGVKMGAKCAYVNLRLHEGHESLGQQLHQAFLRLGKRQWDPPPPTPVARELRKKLEGDRPARR